MLRLSKSGLADGKCSSPCPAISSLNWLFAATTFLCHITCLYCDKAHHVLHSFISLRSDACSRLEFCASSCLHSLFIIIMTIMSIYPRHQRLRSSRLIFLLLFVFILFQFSNLGWDTAYDASAYRFLFAFLGPRIEREKCKYATEWEGYTIKPIAYVFPQFHSIPENDRFWGENFTEWTNVKKVKENRFGIETLHPTKEVGYYDLLDYDVRLRYAKLIRDSGYAAFTIPTQETN